MATNVDVTITAKLVSLLAGQTPAVKKDIADVGKAAEAASRSAGNVANTVQRTIGGVFTSLTRLVTPLLAIVGPLVAIREALNAIRSAEEAEAGERRLQTAIGRNNALYQFRLQTAERLAATSIFDDDAFKAAETALRQFGVREAQINLALQASADYAAQFGVSLQDAANELGKTLDGTIGRVGEKIPQLQGLEEQALRTGAAFTEVGRLFRGADQALAQTDFGRARQATNQLGDQMERIGGALSIIRTRLLVGFVPVLERIADYLSSDRAQQFFRIVGAGLEVAQRALARILDFFRFATLSDFVALITNSMSAVVRILRFALGDVPVAIITATADFIEARVAKFVGGITLQLTRLMASLPFSGVGANDVAAAQVALNALSRDAERTFTQTVGASINAAYAGLIGDLANIGGRIAATIETVAARAKAEADAATAEAGQTREAGEKATLVRIQQENAKAFLAIFSTRTNLLKSTLASDAKIELQELDALLEQKKIRVADYARQRSEIELRPLIEAIRAAQLEVARLSLTAAKEVFTGGDAVPALTRIKSLIEQINALTGARARAESEIVTATARGAAEEAKLDSARRQAVEELQAELRIRELTAQGRSDEAAALQLQLEQQRQMNQLREQGLGEYVDDLQRVQALERDKLARDQSLAASQRQVTDLVNQAGRAFERYERSVARANNLEETGAVAASDAREQQRESLEALNVEIETVVASLEKLRETATDPAIRQSITDQIEDIRDRALETRKDVETLGEAIRESIRNPLEELFVGLFTNINNFREVIGNFFQSLGQAFARLAAQIAANAALNAIFSALGSAGGGFGALFSSVLGTAIQRNAGGPVPGSGPDRDSVPAILTPGEFVVRRSVAQAFAPFLHLLNAGFHPAAILDRIGDVLPSRVAVPRSSGPVRMNSGGMVPSSRGGQVIPVPAYVVPSEAAAERMLRKGNTALLNVISRNPSRFRQALGL